MRTFVLLGALAARSLGAQMATVRGIAFDSLHNVPLNGAFITVSGTSRSAVSDARGAFTIDSVPLGARTFVMQHDALDSLGMPSVSRRVTVPSDANVVIAIPSFGALWRQACAGAPPRDSALLFGVVSDANGARRMSAASVEVRWFDYGVDANNKVTQLQRGGRVSSDSAGAYAICGVPSTMVLTLQASAGAGRSASINLMPGDWRVIRRDLRVAQGADSVRRGTIAGAVTTNGSPVANARIATDGLTEVRTGADGRFVLRNVPVGTRQVEISAIGRSPVILAVDVAAGDTAFVTQDLSKAVELPGVKVEARTVTQRLLAEYTERKKAGLGEFRDSTEIMKYSDLVTLLQQTPSAQVRPRGTIGNTSSLRVGAIMLRSAHGACPANVLLDGVQIQQSQLQWVAQDDIALMEIYSDGNHMPVDIASKFTRNNSQYPCGAVVIWTKAKVGK